MMSTMLRKLLAILSVLAVPINSQATLCNDPTPFLVDRRDISLKAEPCGEFHDLLPESFSVRINSATEYTVPIIKDLNSALTGVVVIELHKRYLLRPGDNIVEFKAKRSAPPLEAKEWDRITLRYSPPPTPTPIPIPPTPTPTPKLSQYTVIEVISGGGETSFDNEDKP